MGLFGALPRANETEIAISNWCKCRFRFRVYTFFHENSDQYYSSHLPDGQSYPIFYHKSITVDDTEKLCYPKGRTFIGGQSIASTFLCSSAVCLLIG